MLPHSVVHRVTIFSHLDISHITVVALDTESLVSLPYRQKKK